MKNRQNNFCYFTNSMQYMLLRELVVNNLAGNIPDYNTKKNLK